MNGRSFLKRQLFIFYSKKYFDGNNLFAKFLPYILCVSTRDIRLKQEKRLLQ